MSDSTASESPSKIRLSMPEAARYAGCSYRHFLKLIYGGEIPSYMAAGHRWADQEDIDAYIARCKSLGPQFRRFTGKRPTGRPKKSKPAAAATAAE
jgi:excisionase family DNA binding protein